MRFRLHTLVDITETGARRGEDPLEHRQQQNFLTVLQTIGLRVNPTYVKPPACEKVVPSKVGLGSKYKTKQNVWEYVFDIDFDNALDVNTLESDFNYIPFIDGLNETVTFDSPHFITKDSTINNIVFELDDK
jgi:hypothetical protein